MPNIVGIVNQILTSGELHEEETDQNIVVSNSLNDKKIEKNEKREKSLKSINKSKSTKPLPIITFFFKLFLSLR